MFWVGLIVVCFLLLALFFGVTIAGGRAHDRQNSERARKCMPTDPEGGADGRESATDTTSSRRAP